jgi:tRNA(Ile)-lysidine synthase
VRELKKDVLSFIRCQNLLKAGDRVAVAVSGGADSVALLRLLLDLRKELGIVLSVVHFNHGLRGIESDEDERFVATLAKRHKRQFLRAAGDVHACVTKEHLSVEAAGRRLRYGYFQHLLEGGVVDRIATGHTLDDQAETVLMRIARGAGTRGLAGIYPQLSVSRPPFSEDLRSPATINRGTQKAAIIRPLLSVRRQELETYLLSLEQEWREDGSNRDLRFARNRVRHGVLPRLERALNPSVRKALAETAEMARAEEEYWVRLTAQTVPGVVEFHAGRRTPSTPFRAVATLQIPLVLELPLALRRRVVRAVFEELGVRLEFRHVEEVLEVVSGSAKSAVLPEKWVASRNGEKLGIEPENDRAAGDYEYSLPVPGRIELNELGIALEAVQIPVPAAYNRENCLEPSLLVRELRVRNWRAGDRFWPAHTKAPKKIKDLLQQRHLVGLTKKLWPVLLCGDEIVWVRGFAVPSHFGPRDGAREVVVIREVVAKGA